jgi:alcohol dehydrogenase
MTGQSLAAVFHGTASQIELQHLPTPVPRGAEILVRVESCTLCGSDLHSYEGRRKVPVPTILGHEIVGRIEAFGPDAVRSDAAGCSLEIGSRVVWGLVAACGECFYCQRDLSQKCLRSVKYGHESFRSGYELLGGLAEHCLLMPGTAIVRLPEDLSLNTISPSGCATATIAAALEPIDTLKDRTICITGAGLLGLTASAMACSRGASAVIVCDLHEERRARAKVFGATHCVTPDELPAVLKEVTGGHGADVGLEVSGAPAAFHTLWPQLRLGGSLILVGAVFPSEPISLAMEQIVRRNLTIRGIHNYGPRHLSQAVEFLQEIQQVYPFDSIVSQWFSLQNVAAALSEAMNPANIRVGVKP